MSSSHDLNARTLELARRHNLSWRQARKLLAERGGRAASKNVRAKWAAIEARRRREERMGLI